MSYDLVEDAVEKLNDSAKVCGIDFLLVTLNSGSGGEKYVTTRNWNISSQQVLRAMKTETIAWFEKMEEPPTREDL
jgi:hypothetical protein